MIRLAICLATALTLTTAAIPPAQAQSGQFAAKMIVNDSAITNFEFQQRVQMLRLFRAPGDIEEEAMKALIEDRLRMFAARQFKVRATPEQIRGGMEEFASRANLTAEQFIQALGEAGVSPETFRDFVEAGLIWREIVRGKFGPQINITDKDIDRAIEADQRNVAVRVQYSEIVIPYAGSSQTEARAIARRLQTQITSEAEFASAARQFSKSASAGRGGRVDGAGMADLPEAARSVIPGLAPGSVSGPIDLGDSVAIYQLRSIDQRDAGAITAFEVDYALLTLPAGAAAEAAAIRAKLDACNDLYTPAKGLPEGQLLRETKPIGQVAADIAQRLALLDSGESIDFPRAGGHAVLMLCARRPDLATPPTRDEIRQRLIGQRLQSYAELYLEELRQAAIIREP